MPRAAIWDSCARAASGAVSRELFDAAASDPQKSLIRRAAQARWSTRFGELFDAAAPGSRKLPEQSSAGRPDRPSSSPGRPRRVADGRTDRPPEDSRPGQQKSRHYGAGGVRRKAERGRRRRRRPPQRCGPRPSPQVTGRPSPSRPDPPLPSPPGGPGTAKSVSRARVPQGPCLRKHVSAFLGGPPGSGGAWP